MSEFINALQKRLTTYGISAARVGLAKSEAALTTAAGALQSGAAYVAGVASKLDAEPVAEDGASEATQAAA